MNGLEQLVTVHSGTGAFRAITSDLLAETYLAPRPQAVDLNCSAGGWGVPLVGQHGRCAA
jgi:hypothetical protein